MAITTPCQTNGAVFHTNITGQDIYLHIELPFEIHLDEAQAEILEANIHNVMELVLAPHFIK